MRFRRRLTSLASRYLTGRPVRWVAKPIFDLATGTEVFVAKALAHRAIAADLSDVTAVIKTFERPRACAQLVASIRRLHPALTIIVVDGSREPGDYPGATTIRMPFDSGVGIGRAAGLERVTTPFVLNLDDDFLFYRGTRLVEALNLLRSHPQIDLLGGQVVDLPFFVTHDFRNAELHRTERPSRLAPGTRIGGAEVLDKVPNFFLARTESVRAVGWDPEVRRLDHADFFTRAKGVIVSGLSDRFRVLHVRDPFDDDYRTSRFDLAHDHDLFRRRYPDP